MLLSLPGRSGAKEEKVCGCGWGSLKDGRYNHPVSFSILSSFQWQLLNSERAVSSSLLQCLLLTFFGSLFTFLVSVTPKGHCRLFTSLPLWFFFPPVSSCVTDLSSPSSFIRFFFCKLQPFSEIALPFSCFSFFHETTTSDWGLSVL